MIINDSLGVNYQVRTKEVYQSTTDGEIRKFIDTYQITKNDVINNKDQFIKAVVKYFSNDTCYVVAARIAKVLDFFNVPYQCYQGVALIGSNHQFDDNRLNLPNHVWLESNYGNYEYFDGHISDIDHYDKFKVQIYL